MGLDKKVAILGGSTSFSSEAWNTYIRNNPEHSALVPEYSAKIEDCIKSVYDGTARMAIVPILNSTRDAAWVLETLGGLKTYGVQICGELEMPIEHCLAVLPRYTSGDGSGITAVRSKDKAIEQCRKNLLDYCPLAEEIHMDSTSAAAEYLLKSGDTSCAAIIPKSAAEKYESEGNLEIIYRGLQDEQNNRTRFIVLGTDIPKATGNDKTPVIFRFDNMEQPGLLYNLLGEFAECGISLAYLQSIPHIEGTPAWETPAGYKGTQLEFEFSGAREPGLLYGALGIIDESGINISHIQSIPNGDLNNVRFVCDLDKGSGSEEIEVIVDELNGLNSINHCEAKPLANRPPDDMTFYMELLGHREDDLLSGAIEAIEGSNGFALWNVCGSYPRHIDT